MDKLHTALGNAYLQRYLLAVPSENIEGAVRVGNEILQVKGNASASQHIGLNGVTDKEEILTEVHSTKTIEEQMTQMITAILKLTRKWQMRGDILDQEMSPEKGRNLCRKTPVATETPHQSRNTTGQQSQQGLQAAGIFKTDWMKRQ